MPTTPFWRSTTSKAGFGSSMLIVMLLVSVDVTAALVAIAVYWSGVDEAVEQTQRKRQLRLLLCR